MITTKELIRRRLLNQQISSSKRKKPGQIVSALGAMQAQDYTGTLWAIGLRTSNAVVSDVEKALADKTVVRTWPMRGTLHFVAAEDIRWMLELLSRRIIAGSASRYKELELDEKTFTRCYRVFEKAMAGGRQLTREEMFGTLQRANIQVDKQRGYHILRRAGQDRIICFGSARGKLDTFALLDEWIPRSKKMSGDEALAELALRYFSGHGPAALDDFVWWSSLKVSDARKGLDMIASKLAQETMDGKVYWFSQDMRPPAYDKRAVYLLPGFDEYMLGYKDRSAALDPKYAQRICPGNNGMFSPTIVIDGKVVGTWKRILKKDRVIVTPDFFDSRTKPGDAFLEVAEKYGNFMGFSVQR